MFDAIERGQWAAVVCVMNDEWRREKRRGVAWRERGKQGGARGSNMEPLCHGNAVKYLWLHRICVWCWKGRVVLADLKVMRASKLLRLGFGCAFGSGHMVLSAMTLGPFRNLGIC